MIKVGDYISSERFSDMGSSRFSLNRLYRVESVDRFNLVDRIGFTVEGDNGDIHYCIILLDPLSGTSDIYLPPGVQWRVYSFEDNLEKILKDD